MKCEEFIAQTETWMEGEKAPGAVFHIQQCLRCRSLILDLEQIHLAAQRMEESLPEPAARVWANIRSGLQAEGLVRGQGWWQQLGTWFPALPRPALAGAYFAFLFVAAVGSVVWNQGGAIRPVAGGEYGSIVTARNEVDQAEQWAISTMSAGDTMVAASYRESLVIVDKAIAMCEKAVREQPRNALAREYLLDSLQQKAELVATMVERSSTGE